ncbi:MAG: hypothetical protein C0518_09220 [Opitutus sp.]|nr:hypothetical protein [Opitutus sp.]
MLSEPKLIFVNRVYWPNEAATAQLLTDLTQGLAARGREVHVVAAGVGPAVHAGVTIHRTGGADIHHGLLARAMNYREFLVRARRVVSELAQPDDWVVLKTDPPMLAAALTGLARQRGARVVQWIQDIYPEIVPQHTGAWLAPLLAPLRWTRNRAWRNSATCVVVGADLHETVVRQGVPTGRVRVMPNWAPRELAEPARPADVAAQRATWDVVDKFLVAYSGNLGRVHEFSTLLDGAERLRAHPGIVFAFVGSGPRLTEVRRSVAARRLTNVRFLPAVPRGQLAVALAAADVHAVTLRGGFERLVNPSKLAGILAAGRPALFVGPTDSAIAALITRERCGRAVPTGAAGELAETILAWRADAAITSALRAHARRAFERHFQFEAQLAAWDQLLSDSADT